MRQTLPIKIDRCENSPRFSPLTVEQVKEKLVKLKSNMSCGPDGIHVNVFSVWCRLWLYLYVTFSTIRFLFVCFFFSYVLQEWRDGNITPLHKTGSRQSCSNYRPITLTSQIVKLLERLVQDQLLTYVQDNIIISSDQHGFQQKMFVRKSTPGTFERLDPDI